MPEYSHGGVDLVLAKLVRERGLLTIDQLRDALAEQGRDIANGSARPLGEILVAKGYLTQPQLDDLLEPFLKTLPDPIDAKTAYPPFGKYSLISELGRGGMGVVYEALDTQLNRPVALKMMSTSVHADEEEVKREAERFLREGRLSANLPKHPNIVGVYDAGTHEGRYFLAMELILGKPLNEWRKMGSITIRQQVKVLRDVALGIGHAHDHGIIHRDLKPQNILIDALGQPHVTDFGLAKKQGEHTGISLTAAGLVMGTPAYMSPEQARGSKDIDLRADVYSLGVLLYEILTGRPPFTGESAVEVIMQVIQDEPPLPSSLVKPGTHPTLDEAIEAICMKAIAKKPKHRYPTAREFAEDLTAWLKGEFEPAPMPAAPSHAAVHRPRPARLRPQYHRKKSSNTAAFGLIAGGVLVGIVSIVWAVSGRTNRHEVPADVVVTPAPRVVPEVPVALPAPVPPPKNTPKTALDDARERYRKNPEDLAGAIRAYDDVVFKLEGTPLLAEANLERNGLYAKLDDEFARFNREVSGTSEREEFKAALGLLDRSRSRYDLARWTGAVDARVREINDRVDNLYRGVSAEAVEAKRKGLVAEVKAAIDRVAKWGFDERVAAFRKSLGEVSVAPTTPAAIVPLKAVAVDAKSLQPGLLAECFSDMRFETLALKRIDAVLVFDWGTGDAWKGGPVDGFSIRWSGFLRVPKTSTYVLAVQSDDGAVVVLDGKTILRTQQGKLPSTDSSTCSLDEGFHALTVEYQEVNQRAHVTLLWSEGVGNSLRAVGADAFFHVPVALKPPVVNRTPLPEKPALQSALVEIEKLFKDEPRKTTADMQALSKKLLQRGIEMDNDPAWRYACFQHARDWALKGGDVPTGLAALVEIEKSFDTSALAEKKKFLEDIRKPQEPVGWNLLAGGWIKVAVDAIAADDYVLARACLRSVETAARNAKNDVVLLYLPEWSRDLAEIERSYQRLGIKNATKTLEEKPDDPKAQLVVGQFLCFMKGDWTKGLPLLAKGTDDALKAAAEKELAAPEAPEAQAAVGDVWWDMSVRQTELAKDRCRMHAVSWYQKAYPKLSGALRDSVRERSKLALLKSPPAGAPAKSALQPPAAWDFKPELWDEKYPRSGRFSVHLRTGTEVSTKEPLPLPAGQYVLSAWFFSDRVKAGDGDVGVAVLDGAKGSSAVGSISCPPDQPFWTFVSATFTVPAGAAGVRVRIDLDGDAGEMWVDDVSIRSVTDGRELLPNGSFEAK